MTTSATKLIKFALTVAFALEVLPYALEAQPAPQSPLRSATVPMTVADNRAFIPLRVSGPTGKSKVVLFWVDSGGDAMFLSGALAHELGLQVTGRPFIAMGGAPAHSITHPRLSIADMDIDLTDVGVAAPVSETYPNIFAGVTAQGFLPAKVLKKYNVVFDYPAHTFTLAKSNTLTHHGVALPMSVSPSNGFARIELAIGAQTYGFMLDTGAAYTAVSQGVMHHWISENPSWPHSIGAVGAANMVGKHFDATNELFRIPAMRWGPILLQNVGTVSRPAGVFEDMMSREMTSPIVGTLAGNVLRQFRLDLDYPAGKAYLERTNPQTTPDLKCIGLIVQVREDGAVLISGVAKRNSKPEVIGIREGDELLQVDDHTVTSTDLASILEYLSGNPGATKLLTIRRGTHQLSVSATVYPHP